MICKLFLLAFMLFQHPLADRTVEIQPSDSLTSASWTIDHGLPVNSVNDIVQDEEGYLWISTYDGLAKFDGFDFNVFNHSNTPEEIPQNRLLLFYKVSYGDIWVSIENEGALRVRDGEITFYGADRGLVDSQVLNVMEDRDGTLWFGTEEGVFVYKNDEFEHVFQSENQDENKVSKLFEDRDGTVWGATHNGLLRISSGETEVFKIEGSDNNLIRKVFENHRGELLVTTDDGVYSMNNSGLYRPDRYREFEGETMFFSYSDEELTIFSTNKAVYIEYDDIVRLMEVNRNREAFADINRMDDGSIWMVNLEGQAYVYSDGELNSLRENDGFDDYYFNRLFQDREGNIWASTARSGVVRIKNSKVSTIGEPEGLTGNNILGLFEDSRGRYWVGTRDEGLNMVENGHVSQFDESLNSAIIYSIGEKPGGEIIVGYYEDGYSIITDDEITHHRVGETTSFNDIRAIHVRADSTIWMGTYGGLVKLDHEGGNHAKFTTNDGLAGNLVRYIDEDENGNLWIATQDGGVSKFDGNTFTNFTRDDGLSSNNIRSIYVDEYENETIWVGTETNGVNRIRGDRIHSAGPEDGLPDHVIHFITQDEEGWLWMSSNRGIFKVNKEMFHEYLDGSENVFDIIHYGTEVGMRNAEANGSFMQGGLHTTESTMWFSTQEGVAIFDIYPSRIYDYPPTIKIAGVQSGSRDYETHREGRVELDPVDRNVDIDFYALTFSAPEKTRYRYRLAGYENRWREHVGDRRASYSELPPGNYTFELKAANNLGVWNEDVAKITIAVTPFIYEQAWFYLAIAALLVFGFIGISKVRYQYLMERQKLLEEKIEEQTEQIRSEKKEVEEAKKVIEEQAESLEESIRTKDKFFSIIAHDLRNPFQSLMGFSNILVENYEESSKEQQIEMLKEMKKASNTLYSLSENLLSWASIQSGKMKPNVEDVDLKKIILENINLLEGSAAQKEIILQAKLNKSIILEADRNMVNLIVRNLVSNAIKFTERGGEVMVELIKEDNLAKIIVSDNGVGMSEKQLKNLMKGDDLRSKSGTEDEQGSGLGLLISNDMVEMHNGTIDVESEEGEGSTFTVTLPLS